MNDTDLELKIYLWEHKITQRDCAKKLGIAESRLSSICSYRLLPTAEIALGIEKITKGKIKAASFLQRSLEKRWEVKQKEMQAKERKRMKVELKKLEKMT